MSATRATSTPSDPLAPLPEPPAGMRGGPGPLLRLVKDQRLAFLIVGGFNTGLGTFWFILVHVVTHGWGGELTTLFIAHVLSVPCAFVLYRYLVFRVRGHVWLDLARFELVNLSTLAANVVLLPIGVRLAHLPVIPAQLLATVVIAVTSYLAHRSFSFRRPSDRPAAPPEDPGGATPSATTKEEP